VDGAYPSINTTKLALNQNSTNKDSVSRGSVASLAFCSQSPAVDQNMSSVRGHIGDAQVPHSLCLVSRTAYACQCGILGLLRRQLVSRVVIY